MKLKEIFQFIDFLNKFQSIERNVKVTGRKAMENDSEHSYQLAMVCWMFAEQKKLKLSKEKIIKYSLAHDLVEVFAGDTDPHKSKKSHIISKDERERLAVIKIKKTFPSFKALHQAIDGYEARKDKESKLVYIMDKILPVINTYNVNDKYYYQNGVTFEKYLRWFDKRKGDIDLGDIYMKDTLKELIAFLKKHRKGFFAN